MGFTLLINQPSIGKNLKKFLDHASKRDEKILHRGGLVDLFGAQVIQSESIGGGELSANRFFQIPMILGGHQISVLNEEEERRITAEFQTKLLGFRCANISNARNLQFDVSKLSFSLRPLAQSFAAATPDDVELQAEIFRLLSFEDAEIRSGAWTDLSTIAVEAVNMACFESLGEAVYIGDLAKIAQEILHGRGEEVQVDPGGFGKKLRLLGFTPEPRDAKGFKLQLTEAVQRRAQQLARDLGAPMVEDGRANKVSRASDEGPNLELTGV